MSEIATTGETVYVGPVEDITEFIQACSFLSLPGATGSLVLLEKQPQRMVAKEDRQNLLLFMEYACPVSNFSEYTAGRIFHEEFELRWERINSGVQVVYIGKPQTLPLLREETDVLKDCTRATRDYYLFGKRLSDEAVKNIGQPAQTGDFAEVRIPRLLRYPVKQPGEDYVKLNVYEYRHSVTNERVLFRFRSLREVKE